MNKKIKRVWTDEQKKAAAERMRLRWEQKGSTAVLEASDAHQEPVLQPQSTGTSEAPYAVVTRERDPEVQAILDNMSPERKAKLAQIQAQTLSTREAQAAIARHELEKAEVQENVPPARIGTKEVSLIVRTDGTMVSQYGPCICGKAKREWHLICLKENSNG